MVSLSPQNPENIYSDVSPYQRHWVCRLPPPIVSDTTQRSNSRLHTALRILADKSQESEWSITATEYVAVFGGLFSWYLDNIYTTFRSYTLYASGSSQKTQQRPRNPHNTRIYISNLPCPILASCHNTRQLSNRSELIQRYLTMAFRLKGSTSLSQCSFLRGAS